LTGLVILAPIVGTARTISAAAATIAEALGLAIALAAEEAATQDA